MSHRNIWYVSLLLVRDFVPMPPQKRKEFLARTDRLAKDVQPSWLFRFVPFTFAASIVPTPPAPEDMMVIDFDHGEDVDMTALIEQVSFLNGCPFLSSVLTKSA